MPLNPVSGTLGPVRARHLLRRLTFGPNQQQIDAFAGLSVNAALSRLFDNLAAPPPPVLPEGDAPAVPPNYAWTNKAPMEGERDFVFMGAFMNWWLGAMYHDNTALEKLVFFLHTIITNKDQVGGGTRDMYWQNVLFRTYLANDLSGTNPRFNRYPQFIKKVIADSSMLSFLDGKINVKGRPNENFAREMFELFTISKGEQRGPGDYTTFTEDDIKSAAKVLTGWAEIDWGKPEAFTPDPDTGLPTGKPRQFEGTATAHDNTVKTFSSVFGGATVTPAANPPTPASMADEVGQLVDMIYAQQAAARYVCRRIHRFFVHWHITDAVENEVIAPMAQTFIGSGFRLRPVLEELFGSEYFYEAATGINDDKPGCIIKSPLELTMGTMRYFNVAVAPVNTQELHNQMGNIRGIMTEMGLPLLDPYDVAGYEAYHQAPGYNRNWITTNTLAKRYEFINKLFNEMNGWGFSVDLLAWANSPQSGITNALATAPVTVGSKTYALDLIKHVADRMLPYSSLGNEITQERYNYFAEYHLGGLEFANWVFNWNNRNGGSMDIKADATARLKNLYNTVMQSPEYQLF